MFRTFFASAALWLGMVAGLAIAPSMSEASKNLLSNPGFEESLKGHPWMPSGWDTSRAGMLSVFFGRDTFVVHGGRYSVSVANVSTFYAMAHNWSQSLVVDGSAWGKDLVFSAWTRSNGVEGRAYLKVDAYQDTISKMAKIWGIERDEAGTRVGILPIDDPIVNLGWEREFFSENETDWVRRELRMFVPPSTNIVFVRGGIIGTGQLILDDASLVLEPARPALPLAVGKNLLPDGDFEGAGDPWEYSIPPYPDIRIERDSTVAHSGKRSLRLTSGASAMVPGPTGVCQVFSNRNFGGKRVRFSGYIKTDSLLSSAFLKLYCQTPRGAQEFVSGSIHSGTTDWSEASLETTLPDDTYAIWVWALYTAPAVGRVYFDDLSLRVLEPSPQE